MALSFNVPIKNVSLNTHGFKSNALYISNLINEYDIIFLSEHWLSKAEQSLITDISKPHHRIYFTPAEKQASGRPYGGNCFITRNTVAESTEVIYQDFNILAIKVTKMNLSYLYIGIYLTSYREKSSIESYNNELNILTSLINTYSGESEIILVGDFQAFPSTIYDDEARKSLRSV